MGLSESLQAQAIRELGEEKCAVCGFTKKRRHSFCPACYAALPARMKKALYTPSSEGYASIYDEAKDWLRFEGERGS
jgi:hypothetical protein